jgi:hypothetical protein
MTNVLTLLALFQLAVPNNATAVVAYPTLGYTLLNSHLVRLSGIPGACAAALDSDTTQYATLQTAAVVPGALLYVGGDTPTLVYKSATGQISVRLREPATTTAISPAGVYFASLGADQLTVYRRNGAAPIASIAAAALPVGAADVTALLVGDYGDIVLNTATGFWYASSPSDRSQPFSQVSLPVSFLHFAPRDHLLLGYEAGQGRVIALHPTSAFAVEPLIGPAQGLQPVTGLDFGANGDSLWLTQAGGPVLSYALPTRQLTAYNNLPIGALGAIVAPGVYLWSQPHQGPALLDTTRSEPAVLLVPTSN